MYLWKIARDEKDGNVYQQTHGAIIAAEYEKQAREIAGTTCGDQDPAVWFLPTTTVVCIGEAVEGTLPSILMVDYQD